MRQEHLEQKIRLITDNTNFDYFEVITFSDAEIDDLIKNLKEEQHWDISQTEQKE